MGNVKLTFTPASDATLFRIRRNTTDIATDVAKTALTDEGSGAYSYTDANAPEGSAQAYQVFQKDAAGNEDNGSNIVSVTPVAAQQSPTADPANRFANQFFGDGNADGVADNCSLVGSGPMTAEIEDAGNGENWQKLTSAHFSDIMRAALTSIPSSETLTITFDYMMDNVAHGLRFYTSNNTANVVTLTGSTSQQSYSNTNYPLAANATWIGLYPQSAGQTIYVKNLVVKPN